MGSVAARVVRPVLTIKRGLDSALSNSQPDHYREMRKETR